MGCGSLTEGSWIAVGCDFAMTEREGSSDKEKADRALRTSQIFNQVLAVLAKMNESIGF